MSPTSSDPPLRLVPIDSALIGQRVRIGQLWIRPFAIEWHPVHLRWQIMFLPADGSKGPPAVLYISAEAADGVAYVVDEPPEPGWLVDAFPRPL